MLQSIHRLALVCSLSVLAFATACSSTGQSIEAETWVGLSDLEPNNQVTRSAENELTTRFARDESERGPLAAELGDAGWTTAPQQLATFDLDENFVAFLVVDACMPERFWVEHSGSELVFTVGEVGATCDQEDPYGALFVLPRSWLTDAGQVSPYSIRKLVPG